MNVSGRKRHGPPSMITYTAYGRTAGSSRVRVFDWLDHLGLDARSFTYADQSSNSAKGLVCHPFKVARAELGLRALSHQRDTSTVLISRQASPLSDGHLESRLLRSARHGVYDFDDALMMSPRTVLSTIWSKRRVWEKSVSAADVVLAGNDFLAEEAARRSNNVVTIPSCVEPSQYVSKLDYEIMGGPVAVWLGSPSTEQYLAQITAPLLELHKTHHLRLRVISAGAGSLGELDRMVDRREWSPSTFASDLAGADFGVMPLEDSPWTRGKCAYKLLQYGATGLPIVGSPVGVNKEVLNGGQGLAPVNNHEWVEAIGALLHESPDRRRERGLAARALVENEFSFRRWAPIWLQAMDLATAPRLR